jgi:hypothetical protein
MGHKLHQQLSRNMLVGLQISSQKQARFELLK